MDFVQVLQDERKSAGGQSKLQFTPDKQHRALNVNFIVIILIIGDAQMEFQCHTYTKPCSVVRHDRQIRVAKQADHSSYNTQYQC